MLKRLFTSILTRLSKFFIRYIFKTPEYQLVFLGKKRKYARVVTVESIFLWQKESTGKKIKSIFTARWEPTKEIVEKTSRDIFMEEIFGGPEDYGQELYELNAWHYSIEWELNSLNADDMIKAEAMMSMTVLTRKRYWHVSSKYLHMNIGTRVPKIAFLVNPMIIKIPVLSIQYFLEIDVFYLFNAIRKSGHTRADDIIAYLYEILYIQQKIAISLHEYLLLVVNAESEKQESILMNAEVDAIRSADLVFTYLKASVEKTIVLLALSYDIPNMVSKKTHRSKIDALTKGLPENVKKQPYCIFVLEFIKSENLDELNSYRTGLLHKKGISDLQPHNYAGKPASEIPLKKVYEVLYEQHTKNTAVLIGVRAPDRCFG